MIIRFEQKRNRMPISSRMKFCSIIGLDEGKPLRINALLSLARRAIDREAAVETRSEELANLLSDPFLNDVS